MRITCSVYFALALSLVLPFVPGIAQADEAAMTPPPPAVASDASADVRASRLAWHRALAIAAASSLTLQLGVGSALADGLDASEDVSDIRAVHKINAFAAFGLYAGSVGFGMAAPPTGPGEDDKPAGALHTTLTWVTAVGMLAAPALGIYTARSDATGGDRDNLVLAHRSVGVVTTLGLWTMIIADWLD